MNFSDYLLSKKIDSDAFKAAEQELWENWKIEFEQVSPTSFTAQKLFLINPVRRKYQLPPTTKSAETGQNPLKEVAAVEPEKKPMVNKPVVPRPVFKTKPKTSE